MWNGVERRTGTKTATINITEPRQHQRRQLADRRQNNDITQPQGKDDRKTNQS